MSKTKNPPAVKIPPQGVLDWKKMDDGSLGAEYNNVPYRLVPKNGRFLLLVNGKQEGSKDVMVVQKALAESDVAARGGKTPKTLRGGNSNDPVPSAPSAPVKDTRSVQDRVDEMIYKHGANVLNWANAPEILRSFGLAREDVSDAMTKTAERHAREKSLESAKEWNRSGKKPRIVRVDSSDPEVNPEGHVWVGAKPEKGHAPASNGDDLPKNKGKKTPESQSESPPSAGDSKGEKSKIKKASKVPSEKKEVSEGARAGTKYPMIHGWSTIRTIHWTGSAGWPLEDARKLMKHFGIDINESSLRTCWSYGKKPEKARPAGFTPEQIADLEKIRNS